MRDSLKLSKFLDHIIFDKPDIKVAINKEVRNVGELVHDRLVTLLAEHGLGHIPLLIRHHERKFYFCGCTWNYNHMANFNYDKFKHLFKSNLANQATQ